MASKIALSVPPKAKIANWVQRDANVGGFLQWI
jgi:hypothetical protein